MSTRASLRHLPPPNHRRSSRMLPIEHPPVTDFTDTTMAIGKRKRASTEDAINLEVFATQLKADPSKTSLLLDLPTELRNAVYEYLLAATGGVRLSRQTRFQSLAPKSALARVNKQIHSEFTSAGWLLADITTECINFDFRHIVTFLNRLSDAELKALPSVEVLAQRTITVEISPDHGGYYPGYLTRWINRVEHPTKKGTSIVYEYKLHDSFDSDPVPERTNEWASEAKNGRGKGKRFEELGRVAKALMRGKKAK